MRAAGAALLALAFMVFVSLGSWQLQRRAWKLELIERVEQRLHADAVEAPDVASWGSVSAAQDEYRRVRVSGSFDHERETRVQAATELGSGYWVLTPLRRDDGSVVLVNRGFVAPEQRERASRSRYDPLGPTTVTGLLRMPEPGGGFLRRNEPHEDRWYSRDVAAIAAARGLGRVAPYFIDADASHPEALPIGGLTVTAFRNHHLVYALTWFGLAALVVVAAIIAVRDERRRATASRQPA